MALASNIPRSTCVGVAYIVILAHQRIPVPTLIVIAAYPVAAIRGASDQTAHGQLDKL